MRKTQWKYYTTLWPLGFSNLKNASSDCYQTQRYQLCRLSAGTGRYGSSTWEHHWVPVTPASVSLATAMGLESTHSGCYCFSVMGEQATSEKPLQSSPLKKGLRRKNQGSHLFSLGFPPVRQTNVTSRDVLEKRELLILHHMASSTLRAAKQLLIQRGMQINRAAKSVEWQIRHFLKN